MDKTTALSNKIEALLFSEGGSLSRKKLAQILQCTDAELISALQILKSRLTGGLALIDTGAEVTLAVAPETTPLIEEVYAIERDKEIGDAGLEVLSVLLYKGPSTRATIDYIRGVNSSFSVRALLARGLIERVHNPEDSREYLYRPSVELMAHLGATESSELPEYASILAELATFDAYNGANPVPSGNAE
ncbi:hypothetical protein EBR66_02875 [bacterium]|nr:hypothetical protein [bacterium]